MKKVWIWAAALVVAQGLWAGSGQTWPYTGGTYDDDRILDWEEEESVDSSSNKIIITGGTFNGKVITGQSAYGNALENTLQVEGGTINSPALQAGISTRQDATNNVVTIRNVSVSGNVIAGQAAVGAASDNTVNFSAATVEYNGSAESPNYVAGGETYAGTAQYNKVNIENGSTVKTITAGGYSAGLGEVSYNTVTITGGSQVLSGGASGEAVFGGFSSQGAVYNNQITVTDAGTVEMALYGGLSGTSAAERNLVTTQKGTLSGNVYGGYSASGNATGNEVQLGSETEASAQVLGGMSGGAGTVQENRVSVASGATLSSTTEIYGGYAKSGAATNNQVTLQSASAGGKAYGGYSESGVATNNTLSVSGASSDGDILAGGWAAANGAGYNTLSVSNATLTGNLYGGYGSTVALGNTASVSGSDITGNVYGGYAASVGAAQNTVSVNGGTITGNVYGGYAEAGESSGNAVNLSGAATVTGDVYGGYTGDGATNNNIVRLYNSVSINGTLSGGNGAESTGNTLWLQDFVGTVPTFSNFDNVTLYGLGSQATFTQDVENGNIILYGRPSEAEQTLAHTPAASTFNLSNDVLGAYAYTLTADASGANTAWTVSGTYQDRLAKPYAQAQLANLMVAGLGQDMLAITFNEAMQEKSETDSFMTMQYYDQSYETGSGFDLNSFVIQGGNWKKYDEKVLGWFLQYAYGRYTTEPIYAKGGVNSYGVGGFALLPYSDEGRFELVLRGGFNQASFSSSKLSSDLKARGFFGTGTVGLLQNVSSLQLYGNITAVYLQGDKEHDNLGQEIKFAAAESLIGQAGLRWMLGTIKQNYKPYVGIAGLYEMAGKSDVRVDGHHKVSETDIDGLTGRAEAGVLYDTLDSLLPMKSSLSVFGQLGQVDGWGINVRVMFNF